jgi:DNA polymerase-3 subunit gamma/tau
METVMTLDKKYRPQALNQMAGNKETIKGIEKVLTREQDAPGTMLLQGPSGCGKTTLARIMATMLGAQGRDFREFNIAKMRGIDQARTIIKLTGIAPWGERRVIILNECHKATNEFQNAMLETLEEPPARNHFILCTTEPNKLLKTIKTRATPFVVKTLNDADLNELVKTVAYEEGAVLEDRVVYGVTKLAEGSPRQALVVLDAIIDLETTDEMLEGLATYTARVDEVMDLCRALINRDPWKNVAPIIKGLKEDPETIRRSILGFLEAAILRGGKDAPRAAAVMDFFIAPTYDTGRPALTQACYFAGSAN